jgi:hypothetical protein
MRPVVVTALLVALSVVGCGVSDEDQALELVRSVCAEPVAAPEPDPATDVSFVEAQAARSEDHADRVARAARLDPTWDALSRAYSATADAWSFATELPTLPSGGVAMAELSPEQKERARDLFSKAQEVEPVMRAECRKATA